MHPGYSLRVKSLHARMAIWALSQLLVFSVSVKRATGSSSSIISGRLSLTRKLLLFERSLFLTVAKFCLDINKQSVIEPQLDTQEKVQML